MMNYNNELNYSEKLEKVAKENGFEMKKVLDNRMGYCYVYKLVSEEREIEVATYSGVDGMHIADEDALIAKIENGEPDYFAEFDRLYR